MDVAALIGQLRQAAKLSDNAECERTTKLLLQTLEPLHVLQIALNQVGTHLETFENLHPEETWVRWWYLLISEFKPIDYTRDGEFGFYDTLVDDFASRAYIDGVALLNDAFRAYFQQNKEVVLDLAGMTIGCLATTRICTYVSEHAPLIWSQYETAFQMPDTSSEEEKWRVVKNFRHSPARKYCVEKYWNEIADGIAAKLAK